MSRRNANKSKNWLKLRDKEREKERRSKKPCNRKKKRRVR